MKFELRKPCANCPFRTDIEFYLGESRAKEIADGITKKGQTFTCHKTLDYDGEGNTVVGSKSQHCAGALIMLEKTERPNQMMRIAERLGLYDHTKLDMNSPVFENAESFKANYKGNV